MVHLPRDRVDVFDDRVLGVVGIRCVCCEPAHEGDRDRKVAAAAADTFRALFGRKKDAAALAPNADAIRKTARGENPPTSDDTRAHVERGARRSCGRASSNVYTVEMTDVTSWFA